MDAEQVLSIGQNGLFMLLTVAGSETTRNAISSGLLKLLAEPDQLEALRRDPSLMKSATEEIIRWSSPVAYFKRIVAEDTQIAGVPVAKRLPSISWMRPATSGIT